MSLHVSTSIQKLGHTETYCKPIAEPGLIYLAELLDTSNYTHNTEDFHLRCRILSSLKILYYPSNPKH